MPQPYPPPSRSPDTAVAAILSSYTTEGAAVVERETLIAEIAAALGIANPTGTVSAQAREEVERRLAARATCRRTP